MAAELIDLSTVDVDISISCTRGSVTMPGERILMYQLLWKKAETFISPGSCSNAFKRVMAGLWSEQPVRKNSSVI